MERIPAAYAMQWSIELEKALRSQKTGRSVEAIQQIGSQLLLWSKEPVPTVATCSIFGLVPGEDMLFGNAILLRLADAFRSGDKETRLAVVKVFLLERKNRGKKSRNKYGGILSKTRVHNHAELLKRVKIVFDGGDVEARALALVLFGCWADFAIDSAHVRYLILSSLVSYDNLEAKASLFAAGCFCELAGDFASVALDMLLSMVTSSDRLPIIRLSGVRAFAKLGCSFSVANRAYKTGMKLVLDSSEEDFVVAMMMSLSKIASKSSLFIFEQVDLLLSFLNQEKTLRLRATALRCLHFIFSGGVCDVSLSAHVAKMLFDIVGENDLPSAMNYEVLQLLHKILLHSPIFLRDNIPEFSHLLISIEKSIQYPVAPNNLQAIHILVDLSIKLMPPLEMGSEDDCLPLQPMRLVSVIIDQIILQVNLLFDHHETAEAGVSQDVLSLLNLLLYLIGKHSDLKHLVLDKINSFLQYTCNVAVSKLGLSAHTIVNLKRKKPVDIRMKLMYDVHNFFLSFIENLNESGDINTEILEKVKLSVDCLRGCSLFDPYMHFIHSMLFHSQIIWSNVIHKNKDDCNFHENLDIGLCNHFVDCGIFSLACSKKMLMERDNWPAYKSGMFAACEGVWGTAAFIFEQLRNKIQSESSSSWLKSLFDFAQSERKIQLFLFAKLESSLVSGSSINEPGLGRLHVVESLIRADFDEVYGGSVHNISEPSLAEVLVRACHGISSIEKRLGSIATPGISFCFQRWFLALREKVLESVVDILKILETTPFKPENSCKNGKMENHVSVGISNSLQQIYAISVRLKRLGQEYDLVATSFIGMDRRSLKVISANASSCFLLAFTTGFTLSVANPFAYEVFPSHMERIKHLGMLIQHLSERSWYMDQEARSNLCRLWEVAGLSKGCFHKQPRNHISSISAEEREIVNICKYAINGIFGLQFKAEKLQKEEILNQVVQDGLQILFSTIIKWLHIPFRVPKCYFNLRACVGSELLAFDADIRHPAKLSVMQGFHLAVNLCLQLRNMPPGVPIQLTKSYCILHLCKSFQEPVAKEETREEMQLQYGAWETDDMIQTNEKLFRYVTEGGRRTNIGKDGECDNGNGSATTYVCFELNDRRQGFSNCLLDVSDFPVGCYRIKWQSCCIDSRGSYWSLLPLNRGPVFTIHSSPVTG